MLGLLPTDSSSITNAAHPLNVQESHKYILVLDGIGGYIRICTAQRTVNVTVNSKTIAVEFKWDVIVA